MIAFISTGIQRREISAGDGYGASWIHPSYGVEDVPATIPSGATLTVPLAALDRQGVPLAHLAHDLIDVKAIRLAELEFPESLDPPLAHAPTADVHADLDTDVAGGTSATFAGLADGRYRIETTIEGRFVRPAPILRVGEVPAPIVPALLLAGVTPSPLVPGVRGRVTFSLPEAANVMLDLYDARGRRVREVASGPFPAGATDVSFDTHGPDGLALGAGVYFLRLSTLSGAPFAPRTSRVVILP
jgi:flagellar hook capping protein FlgD